MDSTTLLIIIGILVLVGLYFFNRNRVAPRGTYDDENFGSSGSIGGGPRAYDDPNYSSSGSIGGGPRTYDDPGHHSSGTIGGSSPTSSRPANTQVRTGGGERPRHNDKDFKSGGSIGG